MRRWRNVDIADGLFPVMAVEEAVGRKCLEKKKHLKPSGYGYGPNESDDELLDDTLIKRPPHTKRIRRR